MTITINKKTNKQETSAPMGAWKCNIPIIGEIMTDRPTKQPTDRRTDRVIGKLHMQYYHIIRLIVFPLSMQALRGALGYAAIH